ncbi:RNA polymerase sigma-54 factor [Novimethylophilus kurashikiensis]|uniref:RNA polymerase sigma-54 factor n=1 Tax=Novimethylophilus kurashikiensis TaxID=1825523 RepID=A0A2R5F9S1_9PROT|nr:RNA polymerase factor sigma-54 [Novimethylophilus kurashikiensis]GBG13663.1 RNA polymerase sigma-54 factor [Novimethylophilus kurashikiensis]
MKQSLQLRLSQHLALTPQLQQSIRLLQLSSIELSQEMEQMLQENPLLERGAEEDFVPTVPDSAGSSSSEVEAAPEPAPESPDTAETDFSSLESERWEKTSGTASDDDDTEYTFQEPDTPTLREHLLEQLRLMPLSERDLMLAALLVDTINDDGYLDQPLEEVAAMLPPEQEIELLELQTALKLVQHLDPIGIGAHDLAECLELQLLNQPEDTPYRDAALGIVRGNLPLLASRDYAKLKKLLRCDDETLRGAQALITRMDPRPGAGFTRIEAEHYVQPEVVVKKIKGQWIASLNNDAVPKLRINRMYADILTRNRDSSSQYLTSQMQEAKWFIKNIQQRFATILRVSQAIVDRQRNFFEHGDVAMRPMVLREIADELGLHESTISRVTTRKYMLTPSGVYELKYFFGSHVATESGGACSATAIRALIKQLVAAEEPRKPLSDNQIADILGQQGIVVARRTIAKYRESLQIPAASQRKSI